MIVRRLSTAQPDFEAKFAAMQWSALGVALQAPREQTVVDLEALVGLTAAVGASDARVWDGAIAWCGRYGRFVNSARLKGVVVEMGIAGAELAAVHPGAAGGDQRDLRRDPVHVRILAGARRVVLAGHLHRGGPQAGWREVTDNPAADLEISIDTHVIRSIEGKGLLSVTATVFNLSEYPVDVPPLMACSSERFGRSN